MPFCTTCGSKIGDEARFCQACRASPGGRPESPPVMSNQESLDAVEQELAASRERTTETQSTTNLLFRSRATPPPTIFRVGGVIGGVKQERNHLNLLSLVHEERDSAFFFKFRYFLESWARTLIGLRDPVAYLESNWFSATQPEAIRLMKGLSKADNIWEQRKQE